MPFWPSINILTQHIEALSQHMAKLLQKRQAYK